jgi:hypothetical protein
MIQREMIKENRTSAAKVALLRISIGTAKDVPFLLSLLPVGGLVKRGWKE